MCSGTLITDQSVSMSLDVSLAIGSVKFLFSLSCCLPTPENFTERLRIPQHASSTPPARHRTFQWVPAGLSGTPLCGPQNVSEWYWILIGFHQAASTSTPRLAVRTMCLLYSKKDHLATPGDLLLFLYNITLSSFVMGSSCAQ